MLLLCNILFFREKDIKTPTPIYYAIPTPIMQISYGLFISLQVILG